MAAGTPSPCPDPHASPPAGVIFHVLNRGNDRKPTFDDDGDFAAFERVLTRWR